MSVNYSALGKRIGYFRMQCGNITQEALASKINRSREFLAKIEKGTEHPSIATLVDRLAKDINFVYYHLFQRYNAFLPNRI